jgi:hypothetical protein
LTNREDPGGEPPSAATSAQAVDAGRVQELRAARDIALTHAQELSELLATEQALVAKLAEVHTQAAEQFKAHQEELVRRDLAGQPVTRESLVEQGRELTRERDLARELGSRQVQAEGTARALAQVQARVQQLERALALAMARARTQAREQERAQAQARAEARSPRLKAMAVARFIWRLLQARPGLWGGIVRNLYLGMRVVGMLVWMLPRAERARWKDESFSELEELKQEGAPLLGDAIRIALHTPRLAGVLWIGAWRRSPASRWLPRLKPVWIGLGAAVATFLTGVAGIGQSPTEFQMRSLVAASMLTGALALTGSRKGRRPRRRRRKR